MNKAWQRRRERIALYNRCMTVHKGFHDWQPHGAGAERCARCTSIRFVKRDGKGIHVRTEIA